MKAMLDFEWCDICSVPEPGAVSKGLCKNGCGQKLVQKCIPLMKAFGQQEIEINELSMTLQQLNMRTDKFHEYRKAKE